MSKMKTIISVLAFALASPLALAHVEYSSDVALDAKIATYGLAVKTKTALKSIIPSGWKLTISSDVILPDTMSWKVGDTWTEQLTSLAEIADLYIYVNSTEKTIDIQPMSVYREQKARREILLKTASTPLPTFDKLPTQSEQLQALNDKVATLEAQLKAAQTTTTTRTESTTTTQVVATETTVSTPNAASEDSSTVASTTPTEAKQVDTITAAAQEVVSTPAQTTSAEEPLPVAESFTYTAPVAYNRDSVQRIAKRIANKYGLIFAWLLPDDVALKGPVTLMGRTAEEDVILLNKAIGLYSPISTKVLSGTYLVGAPAGSDVAQLTKSLPRPEPVLISAPEAPAAVTTSVSYIAARDEAKTAHTVGKDRKEAVDQAAAAKDAVPVVTTVETTATPTSVVEVVTKTVAVEQLMTLSVKKDFPLEDALAVFLRANGYTFEWKTELGGFTAKRDMEFKGKNLAEVLGAVLPKLGISADINNRDKHIVIRPYNPAIDR